jgi:hypothetical protein
VPWPPGPTPRQPATINRAVGGPGPRYPPVMSESQPGYPNLRRGGIQGTRGTAARAREAAVEARAEEETVRARVEQAAARNPEEAIRVMFLEASKAAITLYQRLNRSRVGWGAPRGLVEVSREVRALAERVLEMDTSETTERQLEAFLGQVEERLRALASGAGEQVQGRGA